MAAQIPSSSISRRVPLHARFALRLACISAISLAGVALTGCADAITFSQTETSTGQILLAEGEAEEAAIIFANQVRRSPKDYEAHFHLGQAQLAGGRATEAIRSFKTALEVMPLSHSGKEDDQTRFEIVDALSGALAAHDTDGSLLVQIESKSKGNKTLKLLSAMTYAKAGDPDNAIQRFNEAVNLDREDPYATKQFGLYLESIAQADDAEYQLRRAYRLNTQDQEVAAALRRLGVVPGPAILSATELSKPKIPQGPIPEIKWGEKPAPTAPGTPGAQPGDPAQTAPPKSGKTLN